MGRQSEYDANEMWAKAATEAQRVFDVLQARARQVPDRPTRTKAQQAEHACYLQKSFGTKFAAKFLRNRGWSFEDAMKVLR